MDKLLLTFLLLALLAIFLVVGRYLYQRHQGVQKRLQLSTLFTNITHELLTPLSVVSASIDKLSHTEPQNKKEYDLIQSNIQRMLRLLHQVQPNKKHHQQTAEAPSSDELFINQVHNLVHAHIDDDGYDREALAADMGASASTLYNKLRAITGMHVSAFIRDVRLKEAKRLAEENPRLRVSDLAYSVGFHDPRYFSTCFKKQFGTQPKEYMESLLQEATGT